MTEKRDDRPFLTPEDRLRLHQLMILDQLERARVEVATDAEREDHATHAVPEKWELTRGLDLYDWQKECVEAWFRNKGRGTIKVVTGAGKTILALAIAERLQQEVDPELRVAIVVPTIVLMNQWYDELRARSNLPSRAIGRLGGGYQDDFSERRVLVSVLPSASQKLPGIVRKARLREHLLLIVDECHRAGATEAQKVLKTPRKWSLGLSATPEREEEDEGGGFENSVLGRRLGGIVYDMTLARALELGLLPPFTIKHYALPLAPAERHRYDQLSRQISDAESELRTLAPEGRGSGGAFFRWLRGGAQRSGAAPLAGRYLALVEKRRELLFGLEARRLAVLKILEQEMAENRATRAILFHESIAEVNRLFRALLEAGLPAIAEHSMLPDPLRERGISLFREGVAPIIVSAKALIEGFNVPAADVGVIVASSKSVRQRIQSLGRLLRRHRGPGGEEKTSVIHVLYAKDTVDELIYDKVDWEEITGAEANEFYEWNVEGEPKRLKGPPRRPLPRDQDVDASGLTAGDEYPGRYEGQEFTCDAAENVLDSAGRLVEAPDGLVEQIRTVKGSCGRFVVTPRSRHVLVRVRDATGDWATLYVTTLSKPLVRRRRRRAEKRFPGAWASQAQPGDEYPFEDAPVREELAFGQKRGGVIKKKVRGGEVYARTSREAMNPESGREAERLLDIWRDLRRKYPDVRLAKFQINVHGHAVYRAGGRQRFLAALTAPLEFPGSDVGLD